MADKFPEHIDEKSKLLIRNERLKLTANLLNSSAITIFAAGVVIPSFSHFLSGNKAFPWFTAALVVVSTGLSLLFHKRALKVLLRLRA